MTVSIEPFQIEADPNALDDLRRRLAGARYGDAVTTDWSYGTSPTALRDVIERWSAYDWSARVADLNALPHFRAIVDGIGIHFLHIRGRGGAPRALLLANGWPSSFIEYLRIAHALTDPAASGGDPDDAFDVVIPAMPGYGFSDRPMRPNTPRAYELYHRLMSEGRRLPSRPNCSPTKSARFSIGSRSGSARRARMRRSNRRVRKRSPSRSPIRPSAWRAGSSKNFTRGAIVANTTCWTFTATPCSIRSRSIG